MRPQLIGFKGACLPLAVWPVRKCCPERSISISRRIKKKLVFLSWRPLVKPLLSWSEWDSFGWASFHSVFLPQTWPAACRSQRSHIFTDDVCGDSSVRVFRGELGFKRNKPGGEVHMRLRCNLNAAWQLWMEPFLCFKFFMKHNTSLCGVYALCESAFIQDTSKRWRPFGDGWALIKLIVNPGGGAAIKQLDNEHKFQACVVPNELSSQKVIRRPL